VELCDGDHRARQLPGEAFQAAAELRHVLDPVARRALGAHQLEVVDDDRSGRDPARVRVDRLGAADPFKRSVAIGMGGDGQLIDRLVGARQPTRLIRRGPEVGVGLSGSERFGR